MSLAPAQLELASCWVRDALDGRLKSGSAQMIGRPRFDRLCYAVNVSPRFELLLMVLAVGLALLAFVEPASSVGSGPLVRSPSALAFLVELAALAAFCVDACSKCVYMGAAKYFSKPWQRAAVPSRASPDGTVSPRKCEMVGTGMT